MKLFGGVFVYPPFWALEALLAGLFLGGWAALTVALLAPLTGCIAMQFNEERGAFWQESLSYLRLHGGRGVWNELRRRRQELAEEVAALAAEYRIIMDTREAGKEQR
jgi:hypothetical protein